MDSLKTLIKQIEKKPEMYVGQKSLSLIQAYLYGWLNRDEDGVSDSFLIGEFQEWIQKRYKVTSTQSWAQIIIFYSIDEHDALKIFFRLFNQFLTEKEKV